MAYFLLGACTGIWLMVFAEWYDNKKGGWQTMKTTTSINFDCEMLKTLKQYASENDRSVSSTVSLLINNSEIFKNFIRERRSNNDD